MLFFWEKNSIFVCDMSANFLNMKNNMIKTAQLFGGSGNLCNKRL